MFKYDDGGRSEAGFKGHAGDCTVRSVAVATQRPYQEIYDEVRTIPEETLPENVEPRRWWKG